MDRTMAQLAGEFEFDFALGGINTDSMRPVNEFARARLADVWRRVTEVTGATFGPGLPSGDFIYNSTRACVAVAVVRELLGRPPFEYLQRLQQRFFLGGEDITATSILAAEAAAAGVDLSDFSERVRSPQTLQRVRTGFAVAKSYGTAALPSVLIEVQGTRRLVAGGYIDAATLSETLHAFIY